ncbi:GNAT family N-acetyltransferase [Streptomyces virginiae]|uniref:GNAT family N-acetyltransferase n=1 Tax=Streptomyces TaxID=1883 RepID=UPI0006AECD10|nr:MULTISPECIES: GNAT family N-acetyltransferase [unclassified Streptomyces]GLV91676.1 acetyltransferase [Streptomyces lavendulae subsp. lavendulae]KOU25202.1 acetyltransferase [Streptomyces sp. WM6349]KOU84618.1 acetyltransferase [Streptomyces sp. XY593]KOU93570.1 acetyltransferase [Streptomyces sp. XY533]KOV43536.1 acetyltransferase [Streptomyces sp. H036]
MSTTDTLYSRTDSVLGDFAIRPLDPFADAELLHGWVTHPKASFWMMQDASLPDVEREYMRITAHEHHQAYIGLHEGRPAFLMETYDPSELELVGLYEAQPGDVGMHFLVAPSDRPLHGFTRAVITTVMAAIFADPATVRVVVEPDVANTAVHALNEAVGFVPERQVTKPEKEALLSFCTRAQFEAATGIAQGVSI